MRRSNGEGFLISDGELTESLVSVLTKNLNFGCAPNVCTANGMCV